MVSVSTEHVNTTLTVALLGVTSESSDQRDTQGPVEQVISEQTLTIITVLFYCVLGPGLNVVGTAVNIMNIIVFCKMGFTENINISLLGLSISDLLGLVTLQWNNLCFNPWFMYSDIPFESYEIHYLTGGWTHISFARVTGFLTAYISFERCLCVTIPLKVKDVLTPRKTVFVVIAIFVVNIGTIIPIYTVNSFGWKFYPSRNRSLVGLVFMEDRDSVEPVVYALNNVYGYVAFGVVMACTVTLISKLRSNSKWRADSSAAGGASEKSMKDRRVVLMMTTVSSVFIVCFFPVTLLFLTIMTVPEFNLVGGFQNLITALFSIAYFMETVNGTANFFIYLRMSSKFRSTWTKTFPKLARKETASTENK